MNKEKIALTQKAHRILLERKDNLEDVINKKIFPNTERQHELNKARQELHEISEILERSFVRDFNEKQPAMVQIGTTVTLENLGTSDKREYKIMTRTTADPLKGVISNESPIAQKMLGLNLKNTFKFKDNYGKEDSYKIVSIEE